LQYRTQVIADVLSTASDMNMDDDGVGITALLRRGNMSYVRMTKLLVDLVGTGFLVETSLEKGSKYKISAKGIQFLHEYRQFESFARSFGLRL